MIVALGCVLHSQRIYTQGIEEQISADYIIIRLLRMITYFQTGLLALVSSQLPRSGCSRHKSTRAQEFDRWLDPCMTNGH